MSAAHRRPQTPKPKRPRYSVLIEKSCERIGIGPGNNETYRVVFERFGTFKSYHEAQSFVSGMVSNDDLWRIERVTP